jgi:hypothetical protein
MKRLSVHAATAAKAKSGINDLASVVDGLREKGLLGAIPSRGIEHKVTCSRELLGDELYEKLRRVCYRIEFLGRFDLEQLVRFSLSPTSMYAGVCNRDIYRNVWALSGRKTF